MPKGSEKQKTKILPRGKCELPANLCRPICLPWADRPERISIFFSSEPLGINIEEYKGLAQCTRLFIQICSAVVWKASAIEFYHILLQS